MTTRPIALCPQFDQIPAELRERNQWVVWRYKPDGQKWTKVPYRADSAGLASTTNPSTWAAFAAAVQAYGRESYDGIGHVFSKDDPYAGADFGLTGN